MKKVSVKIRQRERVGEVVNLIKYEGYDAWWDEDIIRYQQGDKRVTRYSWGDDYYWYPEKRGYGGWYGNVFEVTSQRQPGDRFCGGDFDTEEEAMEWIKS
jgi:hypothetical protein